MTFRAIYLIMFQSTLDQESLVTWSNEGWRDLKKQIDSGIDIVTVTLPGRKNTRFTTSFSTFFGGDAFEALKVYIEERRGLDNGPIFQNQFHDPMEKKSLQEYWLRQLRALGLLKPLPGSRKIPRYGRGLHNLRDLARTNWTQRGRGDAEQIEFMMGHKVDANGYFHGEQVVDKMKSHFRTRLPYLNLLTSSKPYGLVSEDTVAELQAKLDRVEAEKDRDIAKIKEEMKTEMRDYLKVLIEENPALLEKASKRTG